MRVRAQWGRQFRYNFGTTEGEKEWPSGSQATPNEALGFFDCIFRDQEVGGSNPLAPTTFNQRFTASEEVKEHLAQNQ